MICSKWSFKKEIEERNIVKKTELECANPILEEYINNREKIQAVKFLRKLMGWSLHDAKNHVDKIERNYIKNKKRYYSLDDLGLSIKNLIIQNINNNKFATAINIISKETGMSCVESYELIEDKINVVVDNRQE